MLRSEPTLLDRDDPSGYLFRLCVLELDGGGGPGGGPGNGIPGFQVFAGDAFRAGPSCGTPEEEEEASASPLEYRWPVDAALFAAGGFGSPLVSRELSVRPACCSLFVDDFRRFARLKKPRWLEEERSRCREDCGGGGGKLGDIGTAAVVDDRWACRGEAVYPALSNTGEARVAEFEPSVLPSGLYGGGGEGIAAVGTQSALL